MHCTDLAAGTRSPADARVGARSPATAGSIGVVFPHRPHADAKQTQVGVVGQHLEAVDQLDEVVPRRLERRELAHNLLRAPASQPASRSVSQSVVGTVVVAGAAWPTSVDLNVSGSMPRGGDDSNHRSNGVESRKLRAAPRVSARSPQRGGRATTTHGTRLSSETVL